MVHLEHSFSASRTCRDGRKANENPRPCVKQRTAWTRCNYIMRPSKLRQIIEGKAVETSTPLSAAESRRYLALKDDLKSSIQMADSCKIQACLALWEINKYRLYRADYGTFGEFCQKELYVERSRAYQMIDVGSVVRELPANVQYIGQNPLQIAALAKVKEGEREAVLEEAASQAKRDKKRLTAKMILEAAIRLGFFQKLLPPPKNTRGEAKPAETKEETQLRRLCDAWGKACDKVRRKFMSRRASDRDVIVAAAAKIIVDKPHLLAAD